MARPVTAKNKLSDNNVKQRSFLRRQTDSPAFSIGPIMFPSAAPMHWINTGETDGCVRSLSYAFVVNSHVPSGPHLRFSPLPVVMDICQKKMFIQHRSRPNIPGGLV